MSFSSLELKLLAYVLTMAMITATPRRVRLW